jgi:integrase
LIQIIRNLPLVSVDLERGVNHLVIARWVGHAGTRMIEQVYAHLSPEFKKGEMGNEVPPVFDTGV